MLQTKLTAAQRVETMAQEDGPIAQGHVRLRLAVASLCGTDLHYYAHFANAGFQLQNAVTLGHEACAYVVDPNGSDLCAGQLVALNPIMNCQVCEACLRGRRTCVRRRSSPGQPPPCRIWTGFSAR